MRGIGKKAFLENLLSARSGIGPVSYFDSSIFDVHSAGEIKDWVPERYFPPHRLKRLDRYAQFTVGSAAFALQDAGLHYSSDNPQTRPGVSFGTALGGVANAEIQHKAFVKGGPKSVHQTLALQVFGGSDHSNAAIEFGLRGVGTTNSNGLR
jgi:3-oxoacyl-[acyl-carrier-protein] synthase II